MPLRAIICEDEPLARLHLRALIAATPELTLAGEAADGASAATLIDRERPDVVFLDIQMPVEDGLAVLARVRHRPAVIFTTAYDAHAVEAFDLGAVDYLLKPFGEDRFRKAVTRVIGRIGDNAASHLVVRHRGQLIPVATQELVRLSADDDLVVLHVRGRQLSLSETLGALMERLDERQFLRVHRSHAVNLAFVAALEPRDANRLSVRMRDGSVVPASRAGTQLLRTRLGAR
jgi:DNA-binding LytR/AlgR family response regulator